MKYNIILAPEAVEDFKCLSAHDRSLIRSAMDTHLRREPDKISKSRIKRLRGVSRPEYRLRVEEFRIFYDITEADGEVLAIVPKSRASEWLLRYGEQE